MLGFGPVKGWNKSSSRGVWTRLVNDPKISNSESSGFCGLPDTVLVFWLANNCRCIFSDRTRSSDFFFKIWANTWESYECMKKLFQALYVKGSVAEGSDVTDCSRKWCVRFLSCIQRRRISFEWGADSWKSGFRLSSSAVEVSESSILLGSSVSCPP